MLEGEGLALENLPATLVDHLDQFAPGLRSFPARAAGLQAVANPFLLLVEKLRALVVLEDIRCVRQRVEKGLQGLRFLVFVKPELRPGLEIRPLELRELVVELREVL